MTQVEMQIGKNGLTEGTFEWLRNSFRTHETLRIRVLKSAGRDREKVIEMSEKILENLGNNYTCKIIGFTIVIRKWRKAKR